MTNLFPGALWVPVPGQEKRAKRRKGRGVGFHVAVHEGPSIEKIDEGTGNDSHLYVRFDGSVEQNIDLDLVSYAMVDGNATLITVESEGGVAHPDLGITADNQPWTPAQVVTNARILRWANDTEGVPLQLMPDSKLASRGACYHRQGIDPWRVTGGEVWSSSRGKVCPGAAKIAQLPEIVNRAINGTPGGFLMALDDAAQQHLADMVGALYSVVVNPVKGSDGELLARSRTTDAGVAALLARNGTIDAAAIAAAIPHDIAQQVIDALGAKLSNP